MGPILGQRIYFKIFTEERCLPAIEHYRRFSEEAFAIPDQRLVERPWLVGEQYSTADIVTFGWTHTARAVDFGPGHCHHLDDWYQRMTLQPTAQHGVILSEPVVGP